MAQLIFNIAVFYVAGTGERSQRIIRQKRQMTQKLQKEIGSSNSGLERVVAMRSYCNFG